MDSRFRKQQLRRHTQGVVECEERQTVADLCDRVKELLADMETSCQKLYASMEGEKKLSDQEIIRVLETVGGMLEGSYGRDEWETVHRLEESIREKNYQSALTSLPALYDAPACFASCQPSPFSALQPVRQELESRVKEQK